MTNGATYSGLSASTISGGMTVALCLDWIHVDKGAINIKRPKVHTLIECQHQEQLGLEIQIISTWVTHSVKHTRWHNVTRRTGIDANVILQTLNGQSI